MGQQESRTVVDVVNDAITNVIVSTSQTGTASADVIQQQKIGGVGIGSTYSQDASVDLKALQKFEMDADILQKMAQSIQSSSEAEGGFLQGTYATNITNLKNYLQTNIKSDTIQNCGASLIAKQLQEVGGVQAFITAKQKASVVAQCVQDVLNKNNVAQNLVTDVKQQSTSTGESLTGSMKNIIIASVIIIIAIIIAIIVIMLLRNKKNKQK